MLEKFSVCVWHTRCRKQNETVHFFMCHHVYIWGEIWSLCSVEAKRLLTFNFVQFDYKCACVVTLL